MDINWTTIKETINKACKAFREPCLRASEHIYTQGKTLGHLLTTNVSQLDQTSDQVQLCLLW